jgi:hypothetical protein
VERGEARVRLILQRFLIGAFILILGFHLETPRIIRRSKRERGSHLEGSSFFLFLFSTVSSSPDFRGNKTTGPCLHQRLPGFLSLTYSIGN